MTVKEFIEVVPFCKDIDLLVNGEIYEMKPHDDFHLTAYGDYIVDYIDADAEKGETCEKYIVHLKMQPVKG